MANEQFPQNDEGLDFEKAKELTVEEAVQKDAEIKAGITEDDDVLDKYIKQHRTEVVSQKFDGDTPETIEHGNTAPLDEFIKSQRQALEEQASLTQVSDLSTSEPTSAPEPIVTARVQVEKQALDNQETMVFDQVPLATTSQDIEPAPEQTKTEPAVETQETQTPVQEMVTATPEPASPTLELGETIARENAPKKTRKFLYWGIGAIAGVALVGSGVWYLTQQSANINQTTTSSSSSSNSTAASSDNDSFNAAYNAFFEDDKQTVLKNDQFDKLSDLATALKKLEGTSYYDVANTKYTSLKRQIEAIQAVNDKFQSAAIVNGVKQTVTVKSDANFDSISSDTLNTGNATLDKLLQEVVADGRSQLTSGTGNQASATDTSNGTTSSSETVSANAGNDTASASGNASSAATTSGSASTYSAATPYGIQSYDESTLQKNLSRVPINESAIADSSNSAWEWTSGVLERIVAISQERGYITGNNYILQKVNIINGNGYYNMYKPDGTYLFSINCKTGYFVGNAAGHSDNLDY